jgi:predicted nucleic acid-binding protein
VPALWPFELFNVLLRALRLGRIDEAGFDRAIVLLSNLNVEVENAPDWDTGQVIFAIAQSQNLTFYDASYLELARRLDLPLATGDEKLQKAAKRMGLRRG